MIPTTLGADVIVGAPLADGGLPCWSPEPVTCGACKRSAHLLVSRDGRTRCVACDLAATTPHWAGGEETVEITPAGLAALAEAGGAP